LEVIQPLLQPFVHQVSVHQVSVHQVFVHPVSVHPVSVHQVFVHPVSVHQDDRVVALERLHNLGVLLFSKPNFPFLCQIPLSDLY